MGAIFRRELKAYYASPLGYIVMAVFFCVCGISFTGTYSAGNASLSNVFSIASVVVFLLTPIITMRLLAEDKRQKTDQLLLTSPVSLTGVVLGKYFAAVVFFATLLSVLVVFQIIFSVVATPDWMVFIGSLVGLFLMACALLAIGLFISSLTESQVVAAVCSLAVSLFFLLISMFSSFISTLIKNTIVTQIVDYVSLFNRYNDLVTGVIDYSNIVYFISFVVVFLFLTVRVLDKKRWA